MDDRKFLDKIRNLQKNGKKIGLTEISDINNLPSSKKLLFEEEGDIDFDNQKIADVNSSNDVQTLEPDEQKEEENKFKDIVSKLVKFDPIKVHSENVEWSGHLIREKIDWTFSLDDVAGCYIHTTDLIQLRDETLEVLKKLRGYYDVWSDEWSGRLVGSSETEEGTTETKPNENEFGF